MPVPTAVAPMASWRTRGSVDSMRSRPRRTCARHAPSSWPNVTGMASMRWVRPVLTCSPTSSACGPRQGAVSRRGGVKPYLRRQRRLQRGHGWEKQVHDGADCACVEPGGHHVIGALRPPPARARAERMRGSDASAGGRASRRRARTWDMFTWSFGCTSRPRASEARDAITSLTFMLLDVPLPVWKTDRGKSASWSPAATASAASCTARLICAPRGEYGGVEGRTWLKLHPTGMRRAHQREGGQGTRWRARKPL